MRKSILTFSIVTLVAAIAPLCFGSGEDLKAGEQLSDLERARAEREKQREQPATPQIVVDKPAFNLGEAIFKGNYKFGSEKANHAPEKAHRLGILETGLPAAEQKHLNAKALASHLTDRETNALEYYVQVKFGIFVTTAPSWAKTEPPIKVITKK